MVMEGLNRLQVYQHAHDLARFVYQNVVDALPPEEKIELTSQIRRAAASIPAEIAEGYGRYYYQESIRFGYLASCSLMELSSHIDLTVSQGYVSDQTKSIVDEKMAVLLKLIHGYINYLKESKRGGNEPGSISISDHQSVFSNNDEDEMQGNNYRFRFIICHSLFTTHDSL